MEEKLKPEHQEKSRFSTRQIIWIGVAIGVFIIVIGGVVAYQLSNTPDSTALTDTTPLIDPENCSVQVTPKPSSGVSLGDFGLQATPNMDVPTQESCEFTPPSE